MCAVFYCTKNLLHNNLKPVMLFDWWKKMKGAKSQTMCRFYAHWQNEGNGTFQQLQHRNSGLPYFLCTNKRQIPQITHATSRHGKRYLTGKVVRIVLKNCLTPEIVNNHIIISSSHNSIEITLVCLHECFGWQWKECAMLTSN